MSTSFIDKHRRLLRRKNAINRRNVKFDFENEHYCAGCGVEWPLSRAHIIRVSYRKDLEMDTANMAYLCLSTTIKKGCHKIWDDGALEEKRKLRCFDRFMEYIKGKDINLYNRINDY